MTLRTEDAIEAELEEIPPSLWLSRVLFCADG